MSRSLMWFSAWLTGWGLTLAGTLSIARLPGDWGNSICGAWGCGPPLQALVACHASWVVVLIPAGISIRRFFVFNTQRRIATTALILVMMFTVGIGVYEYLTWLPHTSDWQRPFYWHRVGFTILTTVELPLLEVAGLAFAIWTGSRFRQPMPAA